MSGSIVNGADNFLAAPVSEAELRERIALLTRRIPAQAKDLVIPVELDPHSQSIKLGDFVTSLSPVPFKVFSYLIQHQDRWVQSAEIQREVLAGGKPHTSVIRVHMHTIRRALGPFANCLQSDKKYRRGYRLYFRGHTDDSGAKFECSQDPEEECLSDSGT